MLNAGPWSCPFAPHEGQKAWKSGRSQNEGIPEANRPKPVYVLQVGYSLVCNGHTEHQSRTLSTAPSSGPSNYLSGQLRLWIEWIENGCILISYLLTYYFLLSLHFSDAHFLSTSSTKRKN
jgi:hypothetical protein